MNILLLHYAAPPIVGGVESVMGWHARLFCQDGHQVRIVAGRGGPLESPLIFHSIPQMDSRDPEALSLKAELDAGRIPSGFASFRDRLASELRGFVDGADVVMAHNICSLNKNLALTAALHRLSDGREHPSFMLWHHDLAWTTPRYRPELHEGYPWDLLRQDWPWAEQIVVSEERRRELAGLLHIAPDRIRVIPNGVDPSSFLKLDTLSDALSRDLHLLSAEPLILLPVRITPRKNIEFAVRLLDALRRHYPNAALVVTGPLGPHNAANQQYLERLRSLRAELHLEHAAHFLAELVEHSIPDGVVADLYRLADVLMLPSREEGFGIPILEAGLAGLPVFCSGIAPLRELGGTEVNYFSADDDPGQVASRVASVLDSNPAYALRKRVLRAYTWGGIYRDRIVPLLTKGT